MSATGQSDLHRQLGELVRAARHRLSWQQEQGWVGVPYDPVKGPYFLSRAPAKGAAHVQHQGNQAQVSAASRAVGGISQPTPVPPTSRSEGMAQLRQAMVGKAPTPAPPSAGIEKASSPWARAPGEESGTGEPAGAPMLKVDVLGIPGSRKIHVKPEISEQDLIFAQERLQTIRQDIGDCERCQLCHARQNIVYGVGAARTRLMFATDAPDKGADAMGFSFEGAQGELIEQMIRAMGAQKHEVYFTHLVKCRPPQGKTPLPEDAARCAPFLWEQIKTIQPEVIVSMGAVVTSALLNSPTPLRTLRGQWHRIENYWILPTFRPAYLLRHPGEKARAWQDLQTVMLRLSA